MSRLSPIERRQEDRADMVRAVALSGAIFGLSLLGAGAMGMAVTGCTPTQRNEAKTVLNAVLSADDEACIVEKALDLPDVNPTVAAIVAAQCNVAPLLLAEVERLLGATRVGVIRYADKVEAREAAAAERARRHDQGGGGT